MNTVLMFLQAVPAIIDIILKLESVAPVAGIGGAKFDTVMKLLRLLGSTSEQIMPIVEKAIPIIVGFFNAIGVFKKSE